MISDLKKEFGILVNESEYGFNFENIFKVIEEYKKNCIPIMGGDVYCRNRDNIVCTYDNWYFNKSDSVNDYLNESIEFAIKYIENYKYTDDTIFVLVPN